MTKEQAQIKKVVSELDGAATALEDGRTLYELGRDEGDDDSIRDAYDTLKSCDAKLGKMEFLRMLSGTHDATDAILSINAGAGGVDSQD